MADFGYDVQVIDHYPQQLHCGICTLIIHNAMNGCSKHVFCKTCIEKYVENEIKSNGNTKCPGGCAIAINPNKLEPNEFVDRLVNTLSCKCPNDVCNWQGDLLDLIQDHQRNCDYNLHACINEGCDVEYYKINVVQHDEVCQYKLIQCMYCETNMLRMDKEQHDIVCLNEQVNCAYHDIGCLLKVYRRDLVSHEENNQVYHIKLVYQNLNNCKNELSASKNEVVDLKQENILLKEKVKKITTAFKEFMKKSSISVGETRNYCSQIADEEMKSESDAKSDIVCLKENFTSARLLCEKVSLINDDNVLLVKRDSSLNELSECYEKNNFDCLINQYQLGHHRNLMTELFGKTPYHWFEYNKDRDYKFIFPLDLNNLHDFEVTIADKFKVNVLNNEIKVENLSNTSRCKTCFLYVGKYAKKIIHQKAWNLELRVDSTICSSPFVAGYACLEFSWEPK